MESGLDKDINSNGEWFRQGYKHQLLVAASLLAHVDI